MANEIRCGQLGANCICSEPMNTATWVDGGAGNTWNPADTTGSDKECSFEQGSCPLSTTGGLKATAVSSGEDITALPLAHTLTYVLRLDTTESSWFGHKCATGTPTALRAIRFYKYWSAAYNAQSNSGDSCNGNKLAQFGPSFAQGPVFTTEGPRWSLYNINVIYNWNQDADCCNGPGPGNYDAGPLLSGLIGNWWRVEILMHNATTTGAGTTFDMYLKNVTANGPELHVLDTSQTMSGVGNNWTTSLATGLHPTVDINAMLLDMFRHTNGSTPCAGFASYSHYLFAAWDTDAGQRIGAAVEVEGSGGQALQESEWPPLEPQTNPTTISTW